MDAAQEPGNLAGVDASELMAVPDDWAIAEPGTKGQAIAKDRKIFKILAPREGL